MKKKILLIVIVFSVIFSITFIIMGIYINGLSKPRNILSKGISFIHDESKKYVLIDNNLNVGDTYTITSTLDFNLDSAYYLRDSNNNTDSLKKYNFIKNISPIIYRFVGKNGLGKTFLVDKIVKNIYYNQNYISINMNDYNSESSLSKLIGSSPGYVGYKDRCIFDSIKDYPFTIILIDNMNNPKSYISRFLLESFEKGYILNSSNEKINLSKCIIFITSRESNSIGFINNKKNILDNTYIFSDTKLKSLNK